MAYAGYHLRKCSQQLVVKVSKLMLANYQKKQTT